MSAQNTTHSNHKEVSADKQLDNIPDELKNRDQWLLWGGIDTKQPHWRGDPTISWSNPEDWHSFEEAVEAASENEEWGIGYVTATDSTNFDEGEYGVIDIDGGVDSGKLQEWVPSINRFIEEDCFIEYSPSGTGMHIPFKGNIPDWWKDGQIGDHEGIDILGNKFCTFTGDTHDEHAHVYDGDIEPWLIEAYKAIHGEYPQTAQTEDSDSETYDEEVLDDEMVGEALDHLDPDCAYSEWRDIAFAVHDYDSTSNGQSLFVEWSEGGSKYDSEAERQIEYIWSNASQGSGITVATLVHKAQQNGWEPDYPTPEGGETIPDGVRTPLHEHEGEYCKWDSNGDEPTRATVTTYTIKTNAILIDPHNDEKQFDLQIQPASNVEDAYDVVVPSTVFNDLREFKNKVQIGTTTAFHGSSDDLKHLRQIVAHQDAPTRIATKRIGLQDGELVTPEGVFTGDGSEPEKRYVPTGNSIDDKWQLEDLGDYDEDEVATILELLPQTRDTERFIPVLGWVYASLYTPWIRDWEGEVGICGIDADTEAGKTATVEYMWRMLGFNDDKFGADTTKFAHLKALSSTTNLFVWIDEYKPSDMKSYKVDAMQDLLRKTTRGSAETRGNADQTVTSYKLEAPVLLSGEQQIQGAAEQRRMIRTQFRKAVTQDGTDTQKAFAKLTGGSFADNGNVEYYDGYDPLEHAKAIHPFVLDSDQDEFYDSWKTAKEHIYDLLSEHNISGIGSLELVNLTMIKFGTAVYRKFASEMGANDPISNEDVEEALLYIAQTMGEENRVSHLEEFLQLINDVAREGELDFGKEYTVVNQGKEGEQLLIDLRPVHQKVTSYVNQHGLTGYDLLNDPNDYRSRFKDREDGLVIDTSKYHSDTGRAIALDMETLEETVDEFDSGNFVN